ncbi:Golgi to ER traffic protein 4 homolog [Aricia agestis]|uniref:Golgi to ER traffic protein 4 homolog n=1 Tax=Aricia agestis TaxID=91739 RepID=UPI001C204B5B|nr:Golgi to ER traffic protein 4 homolog [Aricia agestis]
MATRGERGVSRVRDKLEASVNSGQYYEAHQMYRTLYFRYLGLNKYPDLLDLLYNGATLLLQRDQQGSGADLAVLLIDVLNKSETKPCPEWIEKIAKLFEIMSPSIPEREAFLALSVKWSMDSNRKGHPLLHKKIAEIYWKEKKFSAAHRHFLHSSDGATYATMLIELHTTQGLKSEIDLFITQAVLQCLCLRNIQMATDAFNKYTASHPTIKNDKGPPYLFPLLNFLWFLLKAIEQKHTVQFKILRNCYAISIKRDPNYSVYLDTIGRIWFGIEIPQGNKNSNSLLGGLLNSLIGNLDTSDDEDTVEHRSTAPELD